MKENPDQELLRQKLQPGKLSAEGFLGHDARRPDEIIRDDAQIFEQLGTTPQALASRMRELTEAGKAGLGRPVRVGDLEVTVTDAMGGIPCPFSDAFRADKRQTHAVSCRTGAEAAWSDLNIHMLEKHGFCEGRGSYFRLEPETLLSLMNEAGQ